MLGVRQSVCLSVTSVLELFSIFHPSPGLSGFDLPSSPLLPETPQISALTSKRISSCEMLPNRSRPHRLPHTLASSDSVFENLYSPPTAHFFFVLATTFMSLVFLNILLTPQLVCSWVKVNIWPRGAQGCQWLN